MLKENRHYWLKSNILLIILFCANLIGCSTDERGVVLRENGLSGGKALPVSMKGYELYSWRHDSSEGWRHTLVTGTNRLKSYDEILSGEDQVAESGWVKVTAAGTDELKAQLGRLPLDSIVFWQSGDRLLGDPRGATVMLPESGVVEEIQRYTGRLDIQLHLETQSSTSSPGIGE